MFSPSKLITQESENITMDLKKTGGYDWIHLTQDRTQWRAVVSAVMTALFCGRQGISWTPVMQFVAVRPELMCDNHLPSFLSFWGIASGMFLKLKSYGVKASPCLGKFWTEYTSHNANWKCPHLCVGHIFHGSSLWTKASLQWNHANFWVHIIINCLYCSV
jgi:hypothetical protein